MSPTRLALTTLVALLLLAPAASARIAYTTAKGMNAAGAPIVIANDNGNGVVPLGIRGSSIAISPDGTRIAYVAGPAGEGISLRIRTIATGAEVRAAMVFGASAGNGPEWSSDSAHVLASTDSSKPDGIVTGAGLNVVDAATGAVTVVVPPLGNEVTSYTWSPTTPQFAYAVQRWVGPLFSEVTRIAASDGTAVRTLGRGGSPTWGPASIALHRYTSERWQGMRVWHAQLWLADPTGTTATRQLTHVASTGLVFGPYAAFWAPDGRRLYGDIGGEDMSEPARFNASSGGVAYYRDAKGRKLRDAFPAAISADGATLLMRTGVIEGNDALQLMPAAGGSMRLFKKGVYEISVPPTWRP